LQTFTVRIPEAGLDESAAARHTAVAIGSRHSEVELPLADMLAMVPTLASVWDQPFGDPSMLPTLMLCRAARQQLTVCLAGDGGDEVFAGYNRHALGASLERNTQFVPAGMRRSLARRVLATNVSTLDRLGGVTRVLPPELRMPHMGDKAHKAARVVAGDGGAWEALAELWPSDALGVAASRPQLHVDGFSEVESMLLHDTAVVLPDQMLTKVDRASMAASLEVRLPFLDHRLMAWAWAQPLKWKTQRGVGKVLLRELLGAEIPAAARRPKLGFDPPVDTWLRGPLRPWAEELLRDPVCVREGWLHAQALTTVWDEHQRGGRNHGYRLWPVLMLEGWLAAQR
jgi:asparagine synthase (glutamine-hydrolysing)